VNRARAPGLLGVWVALVLWLVPGLARAGDIEDFQAARSLYEAHDWPRAIAAFEALVGGETPRLRSQPLVLESRKYLAAAYVFEGREEAAIAQLERLLREEPSYELDATQFPREVVQLFERVRTRQAEVREMEHARAALDAEIARLRAENERLSRALSAERTIDVPRSQWLVQIPFGVGQFENGEEGLGWFFLVTEAISAASLGVTLALHLAYVAELQDLDAARDAGRVRQVNFAIDVLDGVNWSSAALLGALAIAGVVQANVAFTPTRRVRVPGAITPPSLAFGLHAGGLGLSGAF
jgi:tetratricopeptide (TPR) repeat protein